MYIYKITNTINNKIYIGKTKDINKRFNEHIRASFNINSKGYENPIHRAIRKYGKESFIIEELDRAEDVETLNSLEKYYITLYNARNNQIGYNIAAGGDGGDLLSAKSEEDYKLACEHIREANLKKGADPEVNAKRSTSMKIARATYAPVWNIGISPSSESIEKFRITMDAKKKAGWKPKQYDHKFVHGKKVRCIETKEIFSCAKEACEKMNLDKNKERNIRKYCNGQIKKPQCGYTWEFVDE